MSQQDKYTKSARGQACTIRIPGVCKVAPDNDTTVPCHLGGAGMALKHASIHLAYGCDKCHSAVDGKLETVWSKLQLDKWHLDGVIRTQILMIQNGVLKL